MRHESPPEVDRHVRDAFECRPEAVARVAAGAWAVHAPNRFSRLLAPLAAAVVVVLVAAAVAFRAPWGNPGPDDTLSLSGFLADGVLVVPLPDGSVSIAGDGSRDDRPPDGWGFVFVEGESQ